MNVRRGDVLAGVLAMWITAGWPTEAGQIAAGPEVRAPAVAGAFYPADGPMLRRAVETMLASARGAVADDPVVIVAPHAGYVFSGQIAADAFRQVQGRAIDLVVLLGANHTAGGFDRIAVYPGTAFRTPLGLAPVDRDLARAVVSADPAAVSDERPHTSEHSIEVLVPFVQVLFPAARIVPIVVARDDPDVCARFGRALAGVLKGRRALVVASSDLSHYPPAREARPVDQRTLAAMAALDAKALVAHARHVEEQRSSSLVTAACGLLPVLTAISAARALGAIDGQVVSYANSSEVAVGDPSRVVGYGAVVLFRGSRKGTGAPVSDSLGNGATAVAGQDAVLTEDEKRRLLTLARDTITLFLETGTVPLVRDHESRLAARHQGAFVTLKRRGQLRGCVGRIVAEDPLPQLVSRAALEAALKDSRFKPVTGREVRDLEIEISLLTPVRRIASPGEIALGRDGVVLQKDGHLAVFLPQVATEQGWTRDQLLDHLCVKADLALGCWATGATLATFQAEVFGEPAVK